VGEIEIEFSEDEQDSKHGPQPAKRAAQRPNQPKQNVLADRSHDSTDIVIEEEDALAAPAEVLTDPETAGDQGMSYCADC